jgi:hydrogenase maturation protein HypF
MAIDAGTERLARRIHVRGVVQGVGFRPFVFRLARTHALDGWVLNGDAGVQIHVEGREQALKAFISELQSSPPRAAHIAEITIEADGIDAVRGFEIRQSESDRRPTTRVSPDLPVCDACLKELFDPSDRRYLYPYINCTNCGPRFSIVRALPYDRARTTMSSWPLCCECAAEYADVDNRRFHAQPVACPACGPQYRILPSLVSGVRLQADRASPAKAGLHITDNAIEAAARLLAEGRIVAVKGIGGYHLACDADNAVTVAALRERKYRKDQAFAVMTRDVTTAEETVQLTSEACDLLTSTTRPIVLAPARIGLPGVAPDNRDFGVMLPYTPLHHLLFACGAPKRLVMTSGNRSSEPIAYLDDDALARLTGLADAVLVGERPIARRVDDSVMRADACGPTVLRRSRGLAPGAVAKFPGTAPILAVGGDLKNAITLVVDGHAYGSQHIGDLSQLDSRRAFQETIQDLLAMYAITSVDLTVAHDRHPEYSSTIDAVEIEARRTVAVQHHRAHVASVLAERGAFEQWVVGVALDGTGYGDDGTIWGGEFFVGSIDAGFTRVAHLRQASLAGGDAAARHPVRAAAGFLDQLDGLCDVTRPPFSFPKLYEETCAVLRSGMRVFSTTSAGRLFDAVAALVGFTRPITFEGQAAMWLEHLARGASSASTVFTCRFTGTDIDWRDMLVEIADARRRGTSPADIARAFHRTLARAVATTTATLAETAGLDTIALSGGVLQNDMLLGDLRDELADSGLQIWINRVVPPNDGGLSLGQAALAVCAQERDA